MSCRDLWEGPAGLCSDLCSDLLLARSASGLGFRLSDSSCMHFFSSSFFMQISVVSFEFCHWGFAP